MLLCLSLESETPAEAVTAVNPRTEPSFAKPDHGTRPKISLYPQNRRPAGGLSRPLPSPGNLCRMR